MKMRMKTRIAMLVVTLALAGVAAVAQAETRFAVQDAAGTTDKMVVTDLGRIGIGTPTPGYALHIVGNGPASNSQLYFYNGGRATGYTSGDSPAINMFRNNDVSVNGGLLYANDRIGYISFGSVVGGSNKFLSNWFAFAESNWTTTSAPTYMTFHTTPNNSTTSTERLRISSNGNIGIGTTNPTQKIEVNGGIRLNTTVAKPATCDSSTRGVIWYKQGVTGTGATADTFEVCAKDASDQYVWKVLF